MITVSVIVPCYNAEKYIKRCMASLLGQTLENMEIIVVNDASEDGTLAILRQYEEQYEQVKVIDSPVRLKPGGARNLGMDVAKGKYIGFFDTDDWVEGLPADDMGVVRIGFPEHYEPVGLKMYEKLYRFAENNDCEIVGCFHHHIQMEHDKVDEISIYKEKVMVSPLESKGKKSFYVKIPIMSRTVYGITDAIYRRAFVLDIGVRFPENCFYENAYFRFFTDAFANRQGIVEECLYCHFRWKESVTCQRNDSRLAEDDLAARELILTDLLEINLLEGNRDSIEKYFIDWYAGSLLDTIQRFDEMPIEWMRKISRFMLTCFPNYANNIFITQGERLKMIILRLNDIGPETLRDAAEDDDKIYKLVYGKERNE